MRGVAVRPSFVRSDAEEKEARKWGRGREVCEESEVRARKRGVGEGVVGGWRLVEWKRAFPVPKGKRAIAGRM